MKGDIGLGASLGVKVFSATKYQEREMLGEKVTAWLRERRDFEIIDIIVRQSSDEAFHCLSMVVVYKAPFQ